MWSAGVLLTLFGEETTSAQDRYVVFDTSAAGEEKSITTWGLDLAWLSEVNVRRGVSLMGKPQVDVIRCSFTGDWPLLRGDLGPEAQAEFDDRLAIVDTYTEADTALYLNNDTETPHASFRNGDGVNPAAWAELISVTKQKFVGRGRRVVSVAPFNEPDFTTWQGNVTRFGDVCWQLRNTFGPNFRGVRLCGGNTLNNDQAAPWYDPLNGWGFLEEGNTHQLAGSFDRYAEFYETVVGNGDLAANDELHNVMEAMVGAEYGMDAGIWWGPAEYARGEFVKTSDGDRLGYAEHRPNWTAASVYRGPDGKVQGFVGESERQALPTTYRFIAKDRPVFFDGRGPRRFFDVATSGGPNYQSADHKNAERVVNITWGEDVPPPIDGTYLIVNRRSGRVMEVASAGNGNGSNIRQWAYNRGTHQQWNVTPMPLSSGGDYSYHSITAAHSGKAADITNFSLDPGGDLRQWDNASGVNQQYVLEYVEDGYFHIRSRWSGLYLEVQNRSSSNGANIRQWSLASGAGADHHQQWRLVPAGIATLDRTPPAAPTGLAAAANDVSVSLTWNPSGEGDVTGYNVYRREGTSGPFEMIARGLTSNGYTDGSANQSMLYQYRVRSTDRSLNRSSFSAPVSATPTGDRALVAHYGFEGNLDDSAGNGNSGVVSGQAVYRSGNVGSRAFEFNGSNPVVIPAEVVNHDEITIATWVRWEGGGDWQRIFDFGNGTDEHLYLTPKAGGTGMQFTRKHDGLIDNLDAPTLATGRWVHLAVTVGRSTTHIYVDGARVNSEVTTIKASDINPVVNLLGDSQFVADPLLDGRLDDFRIYNRALANIEIARLAGVQPLPAPSNLTATVQYPHVALSWNASSGADRYTLKRSIRSGGPYSVIASGLTATGHLDADVVPGTTYYYVVTGTNGVLQSADSGEAEAVPLTPAQVWRLAHFGTAENTGDAADDADPDGDHLKNIVERALHGDPRRADARQLFDIDSSGAFLSIRYTQSKAATDLTVTVFESRDGSPGSWGPAGGSSTLLSDDSESRTFRFTRSAGVDERLFLRLEVTGP